MANRTNPAADLPLTTEQNTWLSENGFRAETGNRMFVREFVNPHSKTGAIIRFAVVADGSRGKREVNFANKVWRFYLSGACQTYCQDGYGVSLKSALRHASDWANRWSVAPA